MSMLKSNFIKTIIVFLGIFIIYAKETYAFYSPTSLHLLAASIGPIIKNLLIIVITAIISIGITKKKNKKKILAFAITLLFVLAIVFVVRFTKLKNLNKMDNFVFVDELKDMSLDEMDQARYNKLIKSNEKFELGRRVDLTSINDSDYDKYKKVLIVKMKEHKPKDAIENVEFGVIWNILGSTEEKEGIEDYLTKFNITKEDKLLFLCFGGSLSHLTSYLLYNEGYDTYYGALTEISNQKIIDSKKIKEDIKKENIIIDSTSYQDNENYYLFNFMVGEEAHLFTFNEFFVKEKLKDNIYCIKGRDYTNNIMKEQHPNIKIVDIKDINLKESKVICLTPLHCLLTKHEINSLDLEVDKIYFPGSIQELN